MRTLHGAIASAVALALTAFAVPSSAAAAPAAPYTALVVNPLDGASTQVVPEAFSAEANGWDFAYGTSTSSIVNVRVQQSAEQYHDLWFSPADSSQPLTVGTTYVVDDDPGTTSARLDYTSNGNVYPSERLVHRKGTGNRW